jgi:hypothetical protein
MENFPFSFLNISNIERGVKKYQQTKGMAIA